MVRRIGRGLAGINAAYQGAIGLLSMASPQRAGAVYQLPFLSPTSSALSRILGGLMVGNALVLAVFARDPEASTVLAPLLLAGCGANLAADVTACSAGEIRWRQVAGSLGFQLALAAMLGSYLVQVRSCPEGPASRSVQPEVHE